MKDTLHTGQEARERLQRGIKKCAEAVGATMGTGGSNALIEAIESPGHLPTNDGATILSSMVLADPIEEMGRKILLEAVSRANKQSGDGSSTTTVLTDAIVEEGMKHLGEMTPMQMKRELEACIPLIEEELKKMSRPITVDEVGQVASISAEDPEIGARLQEIYQKIGVDGIVYWDISKTAEDHYTIGTGITIADAGYYTPYMCDVAESGQSAQRISIKNPQILVTKQKITSVLDFEDIASTLNSRSIKDLVVFCDEVDPLVIPDLVKTRMIQGFRIILVKMPVVWKDQWYQDLALASGAKVVDPAAGFPMSSLTENDLGTFGHITVRKDETLIDGIKDMSSHIQALKDEDTDDSNYRAARLETKTARYYVGAYSESALSYRRLKVEDAISASWQALHGGIVVGGGIALVNVATKLDNVILREALLQPYERICKNLHRVFTQVDMENQNVNDPMQVVINAGKNAVSVAATVLTASTVITLPRQEEPESAATIPVQTR